MFGYKAPVELTKKNDQLKSKLKYAEEEIEDLKRRIFKLEHKISVADKEKELAIEAAKNTIRKEMDKSLIESDLKRVRAEASLETYEKMDTKEERSHIRNMLEKSIEGLSKKTEVNVLNGSTE